MDEQELLLRVGPGAASQQEFAAVSGGEMHGCEGREPGRVKKLFESVMRSFVAEVGAGVGMIGIDRDEAVGFREGDDSGGVAGSSFNEAGMVRH